MICFDRVSFTYEGSERATLVDLDLTVGEGELCVVVGPTGSGKTTLLGTVNGLVPHFTGGRLAGDVRVDGRSTRHLPPRQLADVVGVVGQNPAATFVTDVVEDELAYTMENLGLDPTTMRRRVEDTLDLLGLHDLRDRPLATLSGGQQQRVAIGAVLTAGPRVLVLDEPTSALDPASAEEVLSSLTRLVHDLGVTVLVAEHRLERVLPYADSVVLLSGDGTPPVIGPAAEIMIGSPVAPPLVDLGRLAGWKPLPMSVRDARRQADDLRHRLSDLAPVVVRRDPGDPVASLSGVTVQFDQITALDHVDLTIETGEVVALMGRNGSGKSTLLSQLAGARRPNAGHVRVAGNDPHRLAPRELVRAAGLVPQDAGLLLYGSTVARECAAGDRDAGLPDGTTSTVLDGILPGLERSRHPRDLSEGQRLALALALVLAPAPPLLLLDEPTRGLDYPGKRRLVGLLGRLAAEGHAIVLATHDVELVAQASTRAVVLAEGEVVADGPSRDVVCHSPVFAPQVAKVLAPGPWLTTDEVEAALVGSGRRG